MRAHVFSRFHAPTSRGAWPGVHQTYLLCRILRHLGYEVIHYGCEGADPEICTEHVCVALNGEIQEFCPDNTAAPPPASAFWVLTTSRAGLALRERCNKGDLLFFGGTPREQTIYQAVADLGIPVSYSVRQDDCWTPYKVFPSQVYRHWWYAKNNCDCAWFIGDTAIPDAFEPSWYKLADGTESERCLFAGPATYAAGIDRAVTLARTWGRSLHVIGSGVSLALHGELHLTDSQLPQPLRAPDLFFSPTLPHARFLEEMRKCSCVLCPDRQIVPFRRTAVEAMLSGVPVVAADHSSYCEIVTQGIRTNDWIGLVAKRPSQLLSGASLRSYAQCRYAWIHQADAYASFLQQVRLLHEHEYTTHYCGQKS